MSENNIYTDKERLDKLEKEINECYEWMRGNIGLEAERKYREDIQKLAKRLAALEQWREKHLKCPNCYATPKSREATNIYFLYIGGNRQCIAKQKIGWICLKCHEVNIEWDKLKKLTKVRE